MSEQATVIGEVQFRLGDGPLRTIPTGPLHYELGTDDVTLTWGEGEDRESTAMPRTEFSRYVLEESIRLENARSHG